MDTIPTSFGSLWPWSENDVAALSKYANNRNIWLNMRDDFPHPFTLERARAFVRMAAAQKPVTFYAIATPAEAIGGIGITLNSDVHRLTAELCYWLAEPFWGQGIISEAVAKFTDFMFARLNLVRIYAEPYETNAGSGRVLEKAGFILEGTLRASVVKEGQILNQLMYARINPNISVVV